MTWCPCCITNPVVDRLDSLSAAQSLSECPNSLPSMSSSCILNSHSTRGWSKRNRAMRFTLCLVSSVGFEMSDAAHLAAYCNSGLSRTNYRMLPIALATVRASSPVMASGSVMLAPVAALPGVGCPLALATPINSMTSSACLSLAK